MNRPAGPTAPTLLAVDVQAGFAVPGTAHIPSAIRSACEAFRFGRRIFARFENPGVDGPFVRHLGWHGLSGPEATRLAPEVAGLAPDVFAHSGYSLFARTPLDRWLGDSPSETVLLVGVDTEVCIYHTALELFDRGHRPLVASDLVASCGGQHAHDAALAMLRRTIGTAAVAPISDLLSAVPSPQGSHSRR